MHEVVRFSFIGRSGFSITVATLALTVANSKRVPTSFVNRDHWHIVHQGQNDILGRRVEMKHAACGTYRVV